MKLNRKFDLLWFWDKLYQKHLTLTDWWWHNVSAPRINRKDDRLQARWRKRYGYNQWAQWAPGEDILEHSALVLKAWLHWEWGESPEYLCETHTKEMHDAVERFVWRVQRYQKLSRPSQLPTDTEDSVKRREEAYTLETELYKDLAQLLDKYGTYMWT